MSSRRATMTLFSAPDDPWSHRTRIVIAEKAIDIEIVDVDAGKYPEDLLDLNPYHTTPTLIDRDLVLYDSRVIMEYLDERFPHPPLMPVDPVSRARARLALYQIEHDWYDLARKLDAQPAHKDAPQLRKELRDNVLVERRPVQAQAVLPVRRVLDGGRDHRAHPVAPAALRDRPAAAGATHPQVRRHDLLAPGVSRQPLGERAGDAPGMNDRARNSKRPYLIRAMHGWMMDNGETPHVIVDAEKPGVEVPRAYVKDGKVVLNLSSTATQRLVMGNDWIEFEARFAGVVHHVRIPVSTVLGIYARETGEGMVFSEQDLGPEPPTKPAPPEDGGTAAATQGRQVVRAGVSSPSPHRGSPRSSRGASISRLPRAFPPRPRPRAAPRTPAVRAAAMP